MQRPASVTMVAWIGLGLGVALAAVAAEGLVGFPRFELSWPPGLKSLLVTTADEIQVALDILSDAPVLSYLRLVLALFLLVASVSILRLRRWARVSLEALAWLALLYVVGYAVFYFPARAYVSSWTLDNLWSAVYVICFPLLMTFGYGLPLVGVIALLRCRATREAVVRSS